MTQTKVKEHPILFSAEMVKAILDGRKTQTRRVVKLPKTASWYEEMGGEKEGWFVDERYPSGWWHVEEMPSPYKVGERLWVRETWLPLIDRHYHDPYKPKHVLIETVHGYAARNGVGYRAGCSEESERCRKELGYTKWTPSIHMPRWASRITLEITDVRVQRLQEISEEDAIAEGISFKCFDENCNCIRFAVWPNEPQINDNSSAYLTYKYLWHSIYGQDSWYANPWVWAYTFRRVAQ